MQNRLPARIFTVDFRRRQRRILAVRFPHSVTAVVLPLQTELKRKEQIKSAIVVKCIYYKQEKVNKGGKKVPCIRITEKYHKGKLRTILSENYIDEHITLSGGEIDKKIEQYLENGSNWILARIDMMFIEAYTLRRAYGGSHIVTPKRLANTK